MPTCPNCGEIIMEGDPYCSYCGTHLRWDFNDDSHVGDSSIESQLNQVYMSPGQRSFLNGELNRFASTKNCIINSIYQDYDDTIKVAIKRENKYFYTMDTVGYDSFTPGKIVGHGFRSNFDNLKSTPWFKDLIKQKENQLGLKFYDLGGGYDAKYDWINGTFELKDGCEVSVHFIKDEFHYQTYILDFRNHKLSSNFKLTDRANPYRATSN